MSEQTCPKCGNEDIAVSYHKQGCSRDDCNCAECAYGSYSKRHDEHLHFSCRRCFFDWTGDVL